MKLLFHSNQKGSVAVIALIVLLILTVLGIAAIQNTGLELQMARNERLNKLAFFSAEAARAYVAGHPDLYGPDNLDGPSNPMEFPTNGSTTDTYQIPGTNQTFNGTVSYVSSTATMVTPRGSGYQVGKFRAHWYRMKCYGYGPNDATVNVDQGFYRIGL